MRTFTMGDFSIIDPIDNIDPAVPFITAEIGNNHQGQYDIAEKLVLMAYECGCDAVKFQMRNNRTLYTASYFNRPYEGPQSFGSTYGEHRLKLELPFEDHVALKRLAEQLDMIYFVTPFDLPSVEACEALGVSLYKVASAHIQSRPLLEAIGSTDKPVILSTGGATIEDIRRALKWIGHENVCILHCVAMYPVNAQYVNLTCIRTLREAFPRHVIGWSDHYNGILMASAAYCFGARVFESHITLNHAMKGTDHAFSLQRDGLRRLVRDLHRLHAAWGDGIKRRLQAEEEPLRKMGHGLYAACPCRAGDTITADMIAMKSPALPDTGEYIRPYELNSILGRTWAVDVEPDDALRWPQIEKGSIPLEVHNINITQRVKM